MTEDALRVLEKINANQNDTKTVEKVFEQTRDLSEQFGQDDFGFGASDEFSWF